MSSNTRVFAVTTLLAVLVAAFAALALVTGAADSTAVIVQEIRLPRVIMAITVGAALAVAGAAMQGSLQNPLADPSIIGVSAAAAVGAVIGIGVGGAAPWWGAVGAIITASLAVAVILVAGTSQGRVQTVTVLLAGIAVGAFAGAVLAVIVTALDNPGMRSLTFWLTGSLALTTWAGLWPVVIFTLVGGVLIFVLARPMDVLSLGDRAASAVGARVTRTRVIAMVGVVLLLGPAVAITGVVAFVGLVVPHAIRLVLGPGHRALLPAVALAGALLVLLADTVSRTLAQPVELPLGAVTAAIGAPIFFFLLLRTRRVQGGWG